MRREDIEAYLHRDWDRVAEAKRLRWQQRRTELGPAEAIRVAAELYEQARRLHPDWPTVESRRADLEHHIALSERLRAVGRR